MVKITAGVMAVLISPPLASFVGENAGVFSELWDGEKAAVLERLSERESPPALEMSGSALLLYRPPETGGEIIPQVLPPLEPTVNPSELDIDYSNEPIAQVLSQNIADIREEPVGFIEVDGRIVKTNFPPNGGSMFLNLDKAGQVRNETGLDNDFVMSESRKPPEIRLELNGEPEVLIMHTHTTEAFQPSNYDYFDANYIARSADSSKNIVAVGAEMAKSFAASGITVIHDGTVHDIPYSGAYARSAETVRQILRAYPSIKVVLDIHRDAIDSGDGSRLAPVTRVDGRDAAQVMIISAADDGTYDMPYFLQNFRLASLFQQHMEHDSPGITRPVLFQYCQYNQHLTTGSLLVEVGAYGNTLEEAKYTGQLIGRSMAEALLSLG
jgi:stage II sporulation protein P